MASRLSLACMVLTMFLLLMFSGLPCEAQLSNESYYLLCCPIALTTIKLAVDQTVLGEKRMAASLIRLHFHDCFVQMAKDFTNNWPNTCVTFKDTVNSNTSDIGPDFDLSLRQGLPCPADGSGNSYLAPLDLVSPNSFANNCFRNLVIKKGLLQSDQNLFSGRSTDSIVNECIASPSIRP